MKEKVFIFAMVVTLILGAIMAACIGNRNVKKEKTNYIVICDGYNLETIVIDSCEYLYGDWGNATVLTHKGDCKNPIHYK